MATLYPSGIKAAISGKESVQVIADIVFYKSYWRKHSIQVLNYQL
jgi:hypothetical protein